MSKPLLPKLRTTVYVDANVWTVFQQICEREGVSVSNKVESLAARYVAVHKRGNPQMHLESFFGDIKKKCFCCEGLFPELVQVRFISGLEASCCNSCLENYRGRRLVKKVLGLKK